MGVEAVSEQEEERNGSGSVMGADEASERVPNGSGSGK